MAGSDSEPNTSVPCSDTAEVTKHHYVDRHERTCCQNPTCGIVFGLTNLRRPHHCHRCGEVFCRNCLRYSQKLDTSAQPDVNGTPCKVCYTCFSERTESQVSVTRSHTEYFSSMRGMSRKERRNTECEIILEHTKGQRRFWKDQFQVEYRKECLRLLQGFHDSIGTSHVLRTLGEIRGYVDVPGWQRSTFWELETIIHFCRACGKKLDLVKHRNCRVCGLALCKACAHKELLVFYEDDGSLDKAKLVIIRVHGAPEKEPKYSVLLRICAQCKGELTRRQVQDHDWYMKNKKIQRPESVAFGSVMQFDDHFRDLTDRINEAFDGDNPNRDGDSIGRWASLDELSLDFDKISLGNMSTLMKDQVRENTEAFLSLYKEMRKLFEAQKGELSPKRIQFVQNYLKARLDFYNQTKMRLGRINTRHESQDIVVSVQ
ncbi:uncharacterized protein LOC127836526 [Dreissena polymorpha]|uniref:FYVE-type domain-containing protein n=2 Tax=Dreissena polymorpha TaxID=45954 RepID=A0A9D4FXX8_DREPO|nr:uncharacterized protein LOC127836526 [Dreissena polymorpha]KAH3805151.1 hypothetical protein DPMN_133448 [Dreissena polymorpha]